MTGLEAIWVPMVAGAVVGGGVNAAKGGNFGDIAKGAGLGAAGGAVTGGLASGLGGLAGAAPASTTGSVATGVAGGQAAGPILQTNAPTAQFQVQPADQALAATMQKPTNLIADLKAMEAQTNIQPTQVSKPAQPQQPEPTTAANKSKWTTADYINATSSAANLAANIAQSPETPRTPIAPMPAIFSGQGGDLMQQLSQLSQG